MRSARLPIAVVAFALVCLLVGRFGALYRAFATQSAVDGLLVLSLVVLTGFVGQVSFVQAELAGFGALSAGWLVTRLHWSFWFAMPVAVAATVAVGVVVGLPALRLRGLILGVVTIALALMFDSFVFTSKPFAHPSRVARPALFGWKLTDDRATFAFCLAVFVIVAFLVENLRRSKTGRMFAAIRDSEMAARTAGIDVTRYKLLAFGISAGLAGLSGTLLLLSIGTADGSSFTLLNSISQAAVIVLMGAGYVVSAFAGGVFLVWGSEILRKFDVPVQYFDVVLGGLLVLQLIMAPEGVVAVNRHLAQSVVKWVRGRRAQPAGAAA